MRRAREGVIRSGKYVVYKKVNDLIFFITGSGEYTGLVCRGFVCPSPLVNEILDVIINGMIAMCPKKRMFALEFKDSNTYGKMVAMMDQIIYMVRVLVDGNA